LNILDSSTKKQIELKLRNNIAQDIRYKFLPLCDCEEHDKVGISKLIKEILEVVENGI